LKIKTENESDSVRRETLAIISVRYQNSNSRPSFFLQSKDKPTRNVNKAISCEKKALQKKKNTSHEEFLLSKNVHDVKKNEIKINQKKFFHKQFVITSVSAGRWW
jgi:hypothetical protein